MFCLASRDHLRNPYNNTLCGTLSNALEKSKKYDLILSAFVDYSLHLCVLLVFILQIAVYAFQSVFCYNLL